jgi:hypothetical protein
VLLVRESYESKPRSARTHARQIASAIVSGARDRSQDPHLRPLRDQQRRTMPLTKKRPVRKKPALARIGDKVAA